MVPIGNYGADFLRPYFGDYFNYLFHFFNHNGPQVFISAVQNQVCGIDIGELGRESAVQEIEDLVVEEEIKFWLFNAFLHHVFIEETQSQSVLQDCLLSGEVIDIGEFADTVGKQFAVL